MKILITGSNGFIGKHLNNNFTFFTSHKLTLVNKEQFVDLPNKIIETDVLINLAGVNRGSENEVYKGNINIGKTISNFISNNNSIKKVINISTIKQNDESSYGKGKKKKSKIIQDVCLNNKIQFINLLVPNVFGPFAKPNYNTFISTFCNDLINKKRPNIIKDNEVELIYIDDLVKKIIYFSESKINERNLEEKIEYDLKIKVSEVLKKLKLFHKTYLKNNIIPDLSKTFDLNLFNTFRSYILNHKRNVLKIHNDERGIFCELVRSNSESQFSYSTTAPNIVRGNHFHTRKIERFVVVKGKALVKLRRIDSNEIFEYILSENENAIIDIPIWYTHNIKNIGDNELLTLFWINEFFDDNNPDTYINKV